MTEIDHQLALIESDCYSIDTCVFLDLWSGNDGLYPKDRFTGLWDHIEKLVQQHRIFAHPEVYDELKKHSDAEFLKWLKANKSIFVTAGKNSVDFVQKIINEYLTAFKNGYRPSPKNGADPFVVALAMEKNLVVFTQEKRLSANDLKDCITPKIPNICDEYKIKCVNIKQFMDKENLTLVKA